MKRPKSLFRLSWFGSRSTNRSHQTDQTSEASSLASNSQDDNDFYPHFVDTPDPFADVRERMEELSARDKARFAHRSIEDARDCYEDANHEDHMKTPGWAAASTYLTYALLILLGHILDLAVRLTGKGPDVRSRAELPSDDTSHYALLLKSWDNFYTRRIYKRIQDCFNRPIASPPAGHIRVLERVSYDDHKTMELVGKFGGLPTELQDDYSKGEYFAKVSGDRVARDVINLGSYNYLGFADDWPSTCGGDVTATLDDFDPGMSSSRNCVGTTTLHRQAEELVAEFLGKEDAIVYNMGFNTNATNIPALVGRGDLLISDECNHTSIINGARASGAAIRIFNHNDTKHLERILREAIIMGRPRTRRPWNKILVIVEGIYSMEGEYCDLRSVVRVCKKYGAYIYLDEAHSIGAMGPTGRGCAEYTGVDTGDIDIMMGTFTKSFGAMGGYIAASKDIIDFLRGKCAGSANHNAMSAVVCQQIITSFKVIMGKDGTNIGMQKIQALRDNSNYFRMRLNEMGLQVMGQYDSPVMPVMLYNCCTIAAFSRECLKRGLAVVAVGFPATPLLLARARICMSAALTREDLDRALAVIEEVADILNIRFAKKSLNTRFAKKPIQCK